MKQFTGLLLASGILLAASSTAAQSVIRPGDRVRGSLGESDRTLADGSRYDCFNLRAGAGERISITLRSGEFDAFLSVMEGANCANPVATETDDDSGGGSDARLEMTLGSGPYSFRANAYRAGQGGAYELVVERR